MGIWVWNVVTQRILHSLISSGIWSNGANSGLSLTLWCDASKVQSPWPGLGLPGWMIKLILLANLTAFSRFFFDKSPAPPLNLFTSCNSLLTDVLEQITGSVVSDLLTWTNLYLFANWLIFTLVFFSLSTWWSLSSSSLSVRAGLSSIGLGSCFFWTCGSSWNKNIKNVVQFITWLQELLYVSEYIVKTVPVSLQEVDCLDFSDLVLTFPQKFGLIF